MAIIKEFHYNGALGLRRKEEIIKLNNKIHHNNNDYDFAKIEVNEWYDDLNFDGNFDLENDEHYKQLKNLVTM